MKAKKRSELQFVNIYKQIQKQINLWKKKNEISQTQNCETNRAIICKRAEHEFNP